MIGNVQKKLIELPTYGSQLIRMAMLILCVYSFSTRNVMGAWCSKVTGKTLVGSWESSDTSSSCEDLKIAFQIIPGSGITISGTSLAGTFKWMGYYESRTSALKTDKHAAGSIAYYLNYSGWDSSTRLLYFSGYKLVRDSTSTAAPQWEPVEIEVGNGGFSDNLASNCSSSMKFNSALTDVSPRPASDLGLLTAYWDTASTSSSCVGRDLDYIAPACYVDIYDDSDLAGSYSMLGIYRENNTRLTNKGFAEGEIGFYADNTAQNKFLWGTYESYNIMVNWSRGAAGIRQRTWWEAGEAEVYYYPSMYGTYTDNVSDTCGEEMLAY
ncbi:MAG: hypothetical protein HOE90_03965 [Bacteriovoracaceae bacterium]|nr:hypothetical protein [Bacteriovoracaceae bacterium]